MTKVLQTQSDIDSNTIPIESQGFSGVLTTDDDLLQKMAETIDNLLITTGVGGVFFSDSFTFQAQEEVDLEYYDLSQTPNNPNSVAVFLVGDGVQYVGEDYVLISNGVSVRRISWSNLGLEAKIEIGSKLVILYSVGATTLSTLPADVITVNINDFTNILSGADTDVQQALLTLDTHMHSDTDISVDTLGFSKILGSGDNTLTNALDTLDLHVHGTDDVSVDDSGFTGNLAGDNNTLTKVLDTVDSLVSLISSFYTEKLFSGQALVPITYQTIDYQGGVNAGIVEESLDLLTAVTPVKCELTTSLEIDYINTSTQVYLRAYVNNVLLPSSERVFTFNKDSVGGQLSFPFYYHFIIPPSTGTITVRIEAYTNALNSVRLGVLGLENTASLSLFAV